MKHLVSVLVVAALLVGCAVASPGGVEYDNPISVIHDNLAAMRSSSAAVPLCQSVPCCSMSASNDCGLSSFGGQITAVLPGGDTSCIFGEAGSGPFAFEVLPGARDKLLFYFGGGGACWDKWSTDQGLCYDKAEPVPLEGVFNQNDRSNRYRDWTIVGLLYCSGDLFAANVTRPYTSKDGYPVVQTGLLNTLAVVDWIVQQQATGALAPVFSELSVMGCSAGALAAQLWSPYLLEQFPARHAAVVSDSYGGVFPPGTVSKLIQDYGICDSFLLDARQQDKCRRGQLDIEDINTAAFGAYPGVPHVFIQSKTDSVQRSFYAAVALTMLKNPLITAAGFYRDINDIFARYNKYDNFVTYLVDGDGHCFTPFTDYYTVTPAPQTPAPVMSSWVDLLPLLPRQTISSVCSGPSSAFSGPTTYCDAKASSKTFPDKIHDDK